MAYLSNISSPSHSYNHIMAKHLSEYLHPSYTHFEYDLATDKITGVWHQDGSFHDDNSQQFAEAYGGPFNAEDLLELDLALECSIAEDHFRDCLGYPDGVLKLDVPRQDPATYLS